MFLSAAIRVQVVISVLLTIVGGVAEADVLEWSHIDAIYRSSTVYIKTEVKKDEAEHVEMTGSGFIVNEEGYLLTSNHVIPEAANVIKIEGIVGSKTGIAIPLEVKKRDHANDLALLKLTAGGPWKAVTFGNSLDVLPSDSLLVLGFPKNRPLSSATGILSSKEEGGRWQTNMPVSEGDSGAPIFDKHGKVVAVVIGGIGGGRTLNYLLPINYADNLLVTEIGLSLPMAQAVPVPSRSELTENVYRIDQTLWVVDLTTRIPIPKEERQQRFSKVTVERKDNFTKISPKNVDLKLFFGTNGNKIDFRPISYPAKQTFEEEPLPPPEIGFRPTMAHRYWYYLLVGNKEEGYKDTIVNRYTFYNAFQGERKEWWAAEIRYPTKSATIVFSFPKDKPCRGIRVSSRFAEEKDEEIVDNVPLITEGGRHAYWTASNLRAPSKITFVFDW